VKRTVLRFMYVVFPPLDVSFCRNSVWTALTCKAHVSICFQVGGPIWIGPLHDPTFISKMIEHLNSGIATYGTEKRLRGMLSVAQRVRIIA
jgi:tRNA G26 N,N-dimethylase Trm1